MWLYQVSNPGPLALESDCGPAGVWGGVVLRIMNDIFSYFYIKTYAVTPLKNYLDETVLDRSQYIY